MLKKFFDRLVSWLNYLLKLGGFNSIIKTWQAANAKDRGILLLVFSPMILFLAGLALSVIYFVLFVLPMFVVRVVGCGILASLAGWGGRAAYKYFTGTEISADTDDIIDVEFSASTTTTANESSI